MKSRKDNLYEFLKKDNGFFLCQYLDIVSIFELSLASKRFYLLLNPVINERRYELQQNQKKQQRWQDTQGTVKKKKHRKQKKQNSSESQTDIQVHVNVQKLNIQVARKRFLNNLQDWKHITQSPINNSYLKKKFDLGTNILFANNVTGEILCINRSIVDPTLNYNKGGFDADKDLLQDNYEQLYQGENFSADYDFGSHQSMRKRQKEILAKIQEKKVQREKDEQLRFQDQLEKVFKINKIGVILCFGGSFSLGIYQGERCVLHKSDKKYVCRKKAGERQLNKDKQSGSNIQSMGSQIRRDQEKKHMINVNQILTTHKKDIDECDLVFLQAPGLNRLFIINDSQTLIGVKDRLRSICITAKKANFTEVQNLYDTITQFAIIKPKKGTES